MKIILKIGKYKCLFYQRDLELCSLCPLTLPQLVFSVMLPWLYLAPYFWHFLKRAMQILRVSSHDILHNHAGLFLHIDFPEIRYNPQIHFSFFLSSPCHSYSPREFKEPSRTSNTNPQEPLDPVEPQPVYNNGNDFLRDREL